MQTITKSQFKPKALEIMRRVQQTGEPAVITDHGEAVLELRPYIARQDDPLKLLKGCVLKFDKPTEPVAAEDWEAGA